MSKREKVAAVVLLISHAVGAVGLNLDISRALFESISVVNLLLSFVLIVWTEQVKSRTFFIFLAVAFSAGLMAEIIGVKTGAIFGSYAYTNVLGPAIFGVPLIIGINWAALAYAFNNISAAYIERQWIAAIISAAMMTATDVLLEQLAIKHHFWIWLKDGNPPPENFIAWFGISLVLSFCYQYLATKRLNRINILYLFCLIIFLIADFCLA